MNTLRLFKVNAVPTSPAEKNALYFVKDPVSASVDLWVTDTNGVPFHVDVDSATAQNIVKTLVVEDPTASENIAVMFTDAAVTVSKLVAVIRGSNTPTVTWTLRHDPDRNALGNEVVTGGTTTTSSSTVTVFTDATIPANSFVWFETTDKGGTIDEFSISIIYTKDTN